MGVGQAPLPRARADPERDVVRVVGIGDMSGDVFGNGMLLSRSLKLDRRLRPPPRLPRPRPRPGAVVRRARAAVRPEPGRRGTTTTAGDLGGRRRLLAHRQVDPAVAAGPRRAGRRRRGARRRPTSSGRSCARRSTCSGTAGSARWSRRPPRPTPTPTTAPRDAIRVDAARSARGSWGRAATSASPTARGSSRVGGRPDGTAADQRRLHRQLGGRRLLRPRGQPEDPARPRGAPRRAGRRGAQRPAGRGHRRRRRTRPPRLVPAGADPVAGGASPAPRASTPTRT